ncbi:MULTISPECIES: cell division protein ZapA [unclassified Acidovorax]|uniref:cell division protein ZapA n=1 Tax=unclassified Acidovorax TaxID=2684926 RepID=UPI0006F84CBB|nr:MULTISPECIES: cell division protein ZapA [unclassified Acidovorax]KRB41488.1 cell division protein ZapA [Acidovorax sp. Root70]PUA96200.1 cell division protein ZapA [Acidovorax sp. 107]
MKQIEVQILQQSYLLTCPEGHESRLLDAVERVDTAMTRIRDAGKVRARERIAVLAALNLAFEIADREAADLAAAALPVASPSPSASPNTTAGHQESLLPDSDQQRLQSLVHRLDDALGDDGRLL